MQPCWALAHMAEAAANGEAGGVAAAGSAEHPGPQPELGDADNVPKAVESDPTRRYTRVSAGSAAGGPPQAVGTRQLVGWRL